MIRDFLRGAAFLLALVSLVVCCFAAPAVAEEIRYTKYNIHANGKVNWRGEMIYKASYANYTQPPDLHKIIPAGSKILITDRSRKEFEFDVVDESIKVYFEFHAPRMQMNVDEYIDLITSPSPISLAGLSDVDRKGVKDGKASIGMSKDGVLTALGYPAKHRTPSLDAPTWVYWTNRFGTIEVDFDNQGKVKAVRD